MPTSPRLLVPLTANPVSVPKLVTFGCALVVSAPLRVVATTLVAPKLPTLALPDILAVPSMFAPVLVTVSTFAIPVTPNVTTPSTATATLLLPLTM